MQNSASFLDFGTSDIYAKRDGRDQAQHRDIPRRRAARSVRWATPAQSRPDLAPETIDALRSFFN